jgi:hypothetical protein
MDRNVCTPLLIVLRIHFSVMYRQKKPVTNFLCITGSCPFKAWTTVVSHVIALNSWLKKLLTQHINMIIHDRTVMSDYCYCTQLASQGRPNHACSHCLLYKYQMLIPVVTIAVAYISSFMKICQVISKHTWASIRGFIMSYLSLQWKGEWKFASFFCEV